MEDEIETFVDVNDVTEEPKPVQAEQAIECYDLLLPIPSMPGVSVKLTLPKEASFKDIYFLGNTLTELANAR